MKSCLFLTLVVTTLIFQQSLADVRSDFSIELTYSAVSDLSHESISLVKTSRSHFIYSFKVEILNYTDYGDPERAFFQKIKTFRLGQTNWAEVL